jgi:hypothetical protein
MAETGIFCSGSHVLRKAGAHANATAITQDYYNDFISQAESYINVATRYNWSDNFTTANNDIKMILREAASDLAAVYTIQYDMAGYSSRIEAEDMVNILMHRFKECIKLLSDQVTITYMKGA